MVIGANDNGVPTNSANVTVIVTVMDANDNIPVIEKQSYAVQLPENTPVMQKILHVQVSNTYLIKDANLWNIV